jgi:hypothetical protein
MRTIARRLRRVEEKLMPEPTQQGISMLKVVNVLRERAARELRKYYE